MENRKGFDENFLWGAASASYQVEGASREGGRGPSVWDVTVREPGHILYGENGDVATDQYHRFREDIRLFQEIGLKAYRFSISWSRVLPEGTGKVNEEGLQYYSDLVDALLEAGIEPLVTLYHWDLPYSLYLQGGYANPAFPEWFAVYTKVVVERLSDRVQYWMTMNEPQCALGSAYRNGDHAPFQHLDDHTLLIMTHHYLMAHGRAVQTIREYAKKKPIIGIAPTGPTWIPENESPEAVEAARQKSFALPKIPAAKFHSLSLYSDPMIFGRYPEDSEEAFGEAMIHPSQEEMKVISQPLDFYGMNVYFPASDFRTDGYSSGTYQGMPRTAMDWVVDERSLYWSAKFLYERYHLPILVTENGMANLDWEQLDGKVHDPQRIDFMHRYLRMYKRAAEEGIPLLGYIYWSAMDNFEWAFGYSRRFGLIYVDYRNQKRIIKDSGYWYRHVIETNGAEL